MNRGGNFFKGLLIALPFALGFWAGVFLLTIA